MLRRIGTVKDKLGECPTWDDDAARLLRIDVIGRRLAVCDADGDRAHLIGLPAIPGSFALRASGGMIIAYRARLALRDADDTETTIELPPDWNGDRERFNDGACDANGRFWVGTMDRRFEDPVGALYCVHPNLAVRRMQGGLGMSNGVAWTAESATMFHCDSRPGVIYAYDFDLEAGAIANRRVFMAPSPTVGLPDGCAVDTEGCLWVAAPEVGQVIRFDPTGRVERRVRTPASRPTSVVFGGPDCRTLFITSMQPLAGEPGEADGSVFALEAPAAGVPKHRFGRPSEVASASHPQAGWAFA